MLGYTKVESTPSYPFNPSQMATEVKPAHRMTTLYNSSRVIIHKVPSKGMHYIKGPSSQYQSDYPLSLAPFIKQDEFKTFMGEINGQIEKYWPCEFTFYLAYGCMIFTCFFSLMLPMSCIDETIKFLHYVLERWNETWNPRGVFVDWKRTLWGSYLEFSVKESIYKRILEDKDVENHLEETRSLVKQNE